MREAEALGGERGDEDTVIVDRHDGVEGRPLGEGDDGLGGGLRAAQVHAQRPVSHHPFKRLPPLGGDHQRRRAPQPRRESPSPGTPPWAAEEAGRTPGILAVSRHATDGRSSRDFQ